MKFQWLARAGMVTGLTCFLSLMAQLNSRPGSHPKHEDRNIDARPAALETQRTELVGTQQEALTRLGQKVNGFRYSIDPRTGVTRSLVSNTEYLTSPKTGDHLQIALAYIDANLAALGLDSADMAEYEVTDNVFSAVTGASHIYLRQMHRGIPVFNGQLHVNVNREGRIISVNNAFVRNLAGHVNSLTPAIDAASALGASARSLELDQFQPPTVTSPAEGPTQRTVLQSAALSTKPIEAGLMWLPISKGRVRLVWNFAAWLPNGQHVFNFNIDAVESKVWTRVDWVASDNYKVYPMPVESPIHTAPGPPEDARVVVEDPADATASPFGWHDTNGEPGAEHTITRGNNVHAYEDPRNNNSSSGDEPDGGQDLVFEPSLDLNATPQTNMEASVVNLFYWNNIIHDVAYQYGFDEAGGNFQQTNYSDAGQGNDAVQAESMDGREIGNANNANFATPPDGSRPRMQMFIWTDQTPNRDGDFDSGIVVHEYGHGISNRLVGGPNTTDCLFNRQQPGEGLSDWWSLFFTAEVGDLGTDRRGVGTFALYQAPDGPGIRTQPYSTDPGINTHTYESIDGAFVPHGVGEVWAQAAWEAYWALVDEHGFDPDLYNATGTAGNQRMMLYVMEGLKNSACNPTFTDVRDGIISAALDNHGGEDVCTLWRAFAEFGLGEDAVSGGSDSTSPTNGFSQPQACLCTMPATPSGLQGQNNGDNRIDLTWQAASGATHYNVYRSYDGCASDTWELVAENLTETSYSDQTVSGGTTYTFAIRAKDETGFCETESSNCITETATGACIRPPGFAGLVAAVNQEQEQCSVMLSWNAATGYCGDNLTYNIYRDTVSGFTPSPANRIASCITGSSYLDVQVDSLTTYYYLVRAEDDVSGTNCTGNEDLNRVEIAATPSGPDATLLQDDVETDNATFTLETGSADTGTAIWNRDASGGHGGGHAWFASDEEVIKDQMLVTSAAMTFQAGTSPTLSFHHNFVTENTYDGGVLEYSVDSGTTWHDILAGDGGAIPANEERFQGNGYTGTISTSYNSPIGGRQAFTGNSGGYIKETVDLSDFEGQSVVFRWRMACDSSVASTGWWVDDFLVFQSSECDGSEACPTMGQVMPMWPQYDILEMIGCMEVPVARIDVP